MKDSGGIPAQILAPLFLEPNSNERTERRHDPRTRPPQLHLSKSFLNDTNMSTAALSDITNRMENANILDDLVRF